MKKSATVVLLTVFLLFTTPSLTPMAIAEEVVQPTTPHMIVEPPQVILRDPALKPIKLSALHIETQIIANIATSNYELVFHNPNPRILEGELLFSLLDGQQVIDYALPINGVYRHASVVPKAQAKEAYENTIRAQIDPALLEKTIGNNFKTRLYPLPANGHKRVKITVQELLPSLSNQQNRLQYRVPFVTKHTLDTLKLNITIPALNSQPRANIADIQFDNVSQGQAITLEKSAFKISKPILITLENQSNAANQAFIQQGKHANETFLFASSDMPTQASSAPRALPKKIALIWDASFSNQQRQLEKELHFLQRYLQQVKTATIELVFFDHAQIRQQSLTLCADNVPCDVGQPFSQLRSLLKNSHYHGSSNFAAITISQLNVDEVLLFSNGIKTLFDGELQQIDKPITAINASTQADTALLKHYAERSNGRFIDLMQHNTVAALKQFSTAPTSIKVTTSSANIDPTDIFASQHSNRLHLIAKTKQAITENEKASVTLSITTGQQTVQKTVQLQQLITVKHSLDSLWASKKIAHLNAHYQRHKTQIMALAKRYKILTKDTSLLVLDRVEDYVRYNITPPKELQADYARLLKQKTDKKLYEKEQALIESIKLLQEQKVWYDTTFAKTKPAPKKEERKANEAEGDTYRIASEGRAVADRSMNEPSPVLVAPMSSAMPMPMPMPKAKKQAAQKPHTTHKTAKAEIKLKAFDPKAPYLDAIKASAENQWRETYYAQQRNYRTQPMFYVDVADLFYKNKQQPFAITILSTLLELEFENSEFLRVFAFKAMEWGEYTLAIKALQKVKQLRPFEPQSFRDLALAQAKNKAYQQAADNLYHILTHTWDERFNGIKIVVINELNALLAKHKTIKHHAFDTRLISSMPVDLRIVINWSSDNTDIDLWVIDPYEEKTFYSNKISRIGGKISNDITRGYGPEEFMIKEAVTGNYKIQADYYGNSQQKPAIPVTIRAEIYSNFAKVNEVQKSLVLRLENEKAEIDIGAFNYQQN